MIMILYFPSFYFHFFRDRNIFQPKVSYGIPYSPIEENRLKTGSFNDFLIGLTEASNINLAKSILFFHGNPSPLIRICSLMILRPSSGTVRNPIFAVRSAMLFFLLRDRL
jgi:hypothetical protein